MAIRNAPRKPGSPARVAAVEIGFDAIRAVEVEVDAVGARLLKRGSAPLPPRYWTDQDGGKDALAHAIKAALHGAGISSQQVVTAMPRRMVTLKYARLPQAEPEMISAMVPFEAQQYIPFPLEEVVLGHEVVSDETDEMPAVLIVAARRAQVESLLAAFDAAGLDVTQITVSSFGLAEHARTQLAPVALLGIEKGSIDLAVVSDGKLLFSRAATLPDVHDVADEGRLLAGEVSRTLAAYLNEHRGRPVSSVLVGGAVAASPDLTGSLDSWLDVPVARMNGSLLPGGDPESLAYATAIGLALSNAAGVTVNLIPQARFERKAAARRRVQTTLVLAVVAALAIAGVGMMTKALEAQRKEQSAAKFENNRMKAAESALTKSQTEHEKVSKAYQAVTIGLNRQRPAVDIVKAVSDAVPPGGGVYLTQLTFERTGAVAVHGNSKNEMAATDLVIALQKTGDFTDVKLGYLGDANDMGSSATAAPAGGTAAPKKQETMAFIITCKLRGADVQKAKEAELSATPRLQQPTTRKATPTE